MGIIPFKIFIIDRTFEFDFNHIFALIFLLFDLLTIGTLLFLTNYSIVFNYNSNEIAFCYNFINKKYKYRATEIKGFSYMYNFNWTNSKDIIIKTKNGRTHGLSDLFIKNFKELEDSFTHNFELLALPDFEPLTENDKKFHLKANMKFDMEQKRTILWNIKFYAFCTIAPLIGILLFDDISWKHTLSFATFLSMSLAINSIFRLKEKNSA